MEHEEIRTGVVIDHIEFLELIGKGGFSSVYRVICHRFHRVFVAKVTHVKNQDVESTWRTVDAEIQALMRLNHPNIIRAYRHMRHGNNFILILEYCPNGSLMDYVKDHGALQGPLLKRIVKEICSAIKYAADRGVYHRDIKPGNVLLDENGKCKLADFGISMVASDEEGSHVSDFKCSPLLAAPEILMNQPHDPAKSDLWSLGATILWLAHGSPPWVYKSNGDLLKKLRYKQYTMPPKMGSHIVSILKRLLVFTAKDRSFPTGKDLDGLDPPRIVVQPEVRSYYRHKPCMSCGQFISMTSSGPLTPLELHTQRVVRRRNTTFSPELPQVDEDVGGRAAIRTRATTRPANIRRNRLFAQSGLK